MYKHLITSTRFAFFLFLTLFTNFQHENCFARQDPARFGVLQSTAMAVTDTITAAWTRHYGSGLASAEDEATAMAVDRQGNVYVTGASTNYLSDNDYCTVKYNSSGNEIWRARYHNGFLDRAVALAVDAAGNVYVTGHSDGSGSFDYATIKYDANGKEQWARLYDGPDKLDDRATALVVDDRSNVYVTGYCNNAVTYYDYVTIKYNAAGTVQWVARYDAAGHLDDGASALAVDNSGNVYVTGYSGDPRNSSDYTTIKYDAAGKEQWVARYDGPSGSCDWAEDLAIDGSGNVYVTGYSSNDDTFFDYTTIKYDATGKEQWVARYDGPGHKIDWAKDIAVDDANNVYVTGYSDGTNNYDYATVKYDSAGHEQWVARYNGDGNANDLVNALVVDGLHNVYVTGYSTGSSTFIDYATIKYDATGQEQWVARYDGTGHAGDWAEAICIDNSGNICITGHSFGAATYDYATIKYDSAGNEKWITRFDGPNHARDAAKALAIDKAGNIFITGTSSSPESGNDYVTIKYDAGGNELWTVRYNGSGNADDRAAGLAVDDMGNVYVTGASVTAGINIDYATIKYDAGGNQQWVARYDGPMQDTDEPCALVVDGAGTVYVTGFSVGTGNCDYTTIKYDTHGNEQWVAMYNGANNANDLPSALAVDEAKNVYVTGHSYVLDDSMSTLGDYATVKYDMYGHELWSARYNNIDNLDDAASDLAVDKSGNVFVTGMSYSLAVGADYATVKYDALGNEQWVRRYNGVGNSSDAARALSLDKSGDILVTGHSIGANSYYDYATLKYDTDGQEKWIRRFSGSGQTDKLARAMAIDHAGNIYVTGYNTTTNTFDDYTTIKYDRDGNEQWLAMFDGPGQARDIPEDIGVDDWGNVYVTGSSSNSGDEKSVFTTIRYTPRSTMVQGNNPIIPQTCRLEQNYPNPFNPSTQIVYHLSQSSMVSLKVYDLLGREMAILIQKYQQPGSYTVRFNTAGVGRQFSSGLYVYRLEAGQFSEQKKMILVK